MNDDKKELKENEDEKTTSYSIPTTTLTDSTTTPTYDYKEQRKIIKDWAKTHIVGNSYYVPSLGYDVSITMSGIKKALNQMHPDPKVRDGIIKNIVPELNSAVMVAEAVDGKGDPNFYYYYLECTTVTPSNYIVLRKTLCDGVISFYCIVENIKK